MEKVWIKASVWKKKDNRIKTNRKSEIKSTKGVSRAREENAYEKKAKEFFFLSNGNQLTSEKTAFCVRFVYGKINWNQRQFVFVQSGLPATLNHQMYTQSISV